MIGTFNWQVKCWTHDDLNFAFSATKKRIEGKYDDGGEGKLVQEPESKVACTVLNANSLPEKHVRQLIK